MQALSCLFFFFALCSLGQDKETGEFMLSLGICEVAVGWYTDASQLTGCLWLSWFEQEVDFHFRKSLLLSGS